MVKAEVKVIPYMNPSFEAGANLHFRENSDADVVDTRVWSIIEWKEILLF